jgi:hypothetical protein
MKRERKSMLGKRPIGFHGRWIKTIPRQVSISAPPFCSVIFRMKTSSIVVICLAVTLAGAQAQVARAADPAATNTAGEIACRTNLAT